MTTSSDERNPVEALAEEFLDRKRRGEHPTLREYVERHPDLADEIRDLFPALLMMEDLGEDSGGATGSLAAANGPALGIRLERLGDYRILREIGRGGMGVVYEAEQESLGRRVALKVLSAGLLLDPKQVRRFEREAKAAARLHHTNIVPVFGVGRQDGHHYFVMQFIAGLGLDMVLDDLRRLRRAKSEASPAVGPVPAASRVTGLTGVDVARSLISGRFDVDKPPGEGSVTEPLDDAAPAAPNGPTADSGSSPAILPGSSELSASSDPDRQFYRSVARIGIQVAEALEYANRQGILHRDVKPSNLLLDNHGNVWVADFGLAKTAEADDLTDTGDILGTIRYMAPERFSGHCDARSDVYSLGLTLYELVALRPAYEASDRNTLIDRVLHEEPERLKKGAPGVPRDLETIVTKAMARDPAGRYTTASALADDLRRYVEDRPIRARRISPVERLARWCRRNKVLAASIGVAAAALVAAVVLSLLYANRQARHAAEQAEANREIRRLAGNLEKEGEHLKDERVNLKTALAESNRRLAMLNFERGQVAFEQGQVGPGMLWTVESLRMAAAAGDEAGKHAALANLAAWRRHYTDLKAVFSHDGEVEAVAFSPDSKTILTGSDDGTARLWDAATGRPVGQPMVHQSFVRAVAFSPDGRTVATASEDNTARLWEAATGRPIGPPLQHKDLSAVLAFSPDGKVIVTGDANMARLWNTATGMPIGQPMIHRDYVWKVAFSPDGKTILTGSRDKTARLWNAASGQPISMPMVHQDPVSAVAFSPDGQMVATGSWNKTARLWDATSSRPIGPPMVNQSSVRAVAFSPDGRTLLTVAEKTARLWVVRTGEALGKPMEHQGSVITAAFSPDGKTILTASRDKTARLWDAVTGRPVGEPLLHQNIVWVAAFSPDGKTILTGSWDKTARLWDAATTRPIGRPLEPPIDSSSYAAFSPDGRVILALGYYEAWLCDTRSGRPIGQPLVHQGGRTTTARFSPDAKMVLTGGEDKTARLWDAATARPIGRVLKHPSPLADARFSPDGKTILTMSSDKTVWLWEASTGRQLGSPMEHQGLVRAALFSPDGKTILSGSHDKTARLWDAATGQPIGQPMQHPDKVLAVAFSPDGKMILTGSQDKMARFWDAATGQPAGRPMIHQGPVYSVRFSPDGRTILTKSDRKAQLWDATTRHLVGSPMEHEAMVDAAVFSPDGKMLLTGGSDKTARFWDAATGRPLGPPLEHRGGVYAVAFSPDGKTLLTAGEDLVAWLWDAPAPLPNDLPRLAAWVETLTGLELDEGGGVRPLDSATWLGRRERLAQLGGPPASDPAPRLDPILFGPDPTARGDALAERGQLEQAEAAYAEVTRVRPLNGFVWGAWSRFYVSCARPERAAAILAEAIRLLPDLGWLRRWHCLSLLTAGDRIGRERAITDLLDRFQGTKTTVDDDSVAWVCVLGPDSIADSRVPIRMAEAAVQGAPENRKAYHLRALGAALYRAGRFEDAIRRLEESVQLQSGDGLPVDWAFLAMAHHRLRHRDETRRWLDRVRNHEPGTDPDKFWDELEIRLLRSEAEAVILYDPIFPADPFAH